MYNYTMGDHHIVDIFFLEEILPFTIEELPCEPAEILGRSIHETSDKATLENGHG